MTALIGRRRPASAPEHQLSSTGHGDCPLRHSFASHWVAGIAGKKNAGDGTSASGAPMAGIEELMIYGCDELWPRASRPPISIEGRIAQPSGYEMILAEPETVPMRAGRPHHSDSRDAFASLAPLRFNSLRHGHGEVQAKKMPPTLGGA